MSYIEYIMIRFIKGPLFFSALFIIISNSFIYPQILSNVDSKCLWVKKTNVLDSTSIDSVFSFALENKINKLFIESMSDGEVLFNSNLISKYEQVDSLFDPLNYLLSKAEFSSIEIHAWFNTYLLWSKSTLPPNKDHFYYNCGDCFESDFNGKSDGEIDLQLNQSKTWEGVYISPMHSKANNYLLSVINDLFDNYSIDGLLLDYIRYQDNFYGYNKQGINDFINIYNIDPRDINRGIISTRFGYSEDLIDSINNSWNSFRENKISEFVRSVKYNILKDSLSISLSVAVKPDYIMAKERWHQNWLSWINEGLVDFAIIKNYSNNFSEFNYINKMISSKVPDYIQKNKIFIGLDFFNDNPILLSNKILLSRLQGYENFSISTYNIDKDTLGLYLPIFKSMNFHLEK